MSGETVQTFRISQSTTQTFRDLYIRNTLLVLIQSGSKRLHRGASENWVAQPGELLIFPSGTMITIENRILSGSDYVADCVSYPDYMIAEIFPDRSAGDKVPPAILVKDCPTALAELLLNLEHTVTNDDSPGALVRHRLLEPLVWLKSLGIELAIHQEKTLDCRLRDLISTDVAEKWRAASVSRELGCSEATLRRRLGELGTSFSKVLMDVRLEHGLTQLQSTGKAVSKVALDCGFASPSHFADAFKARFEITPKEIRAAAS